MGKTQNSDAPVPPVVLSRDEEFGILVSTVKQYAVFLMDPAGLITSWNEGAKNIMRYNGSEIIGKHIAVLYTKKDIKKGLPAQNLRSAKEQGSFEDEGWRVTKSGKLVWANVVFTNVYNEKHEVIGFANVTRVISKQKKPSGDLPLVYQCAFDQLLFQIDNTPLGFIEWDNKLHIRALSKRAEEIFGWGLEEFVELKKTGLTQVYKEDLPLVAVIAAQLLSGNVIRNHVQHRNYTKDGNVIWCEWFNTVLKDKAGKVITIMSFVQDITTRKLEEEALRRSTSHLKTIFESTCQGVILADTDGIVSSFNTKAADIVFLTTASELMIGSNIFDSSKHIVREDLRQKILELFPGHSIQRDRYYK